MLRGTAAATLSFAVVACQPPASEEVYNEFFPVNKPARTAAGSAGLSGNGRVEIECMAAA